MLFALEGLGDLVELRHRAALQVVLSGLEEDLALERDDHAAVVILDRRDLGDRIAGILELRLHVRQLGGLGGGRGLLLLELHLGLAEGRSRLAELPVRVRQLRGGHDFALGLGQLGVLLCLDRRRRGLGELRFAIGDDGEVDRRRIVRRIAPGLLGLLQREVSLVDVGRVELHRHAVLRVEVLVAGVGERLRGDAFAGTTGSREDHERNAEHENAIRNHGNSP